MTFDVMRNGQRFLIAATSLVVTLAHGQKPPAELLESVNALSLSRATLDVCLASPDFRKLADTTQRQTLAISNRIDRMANDMHESSKGRLLFISYTLTVSKYAHSADFRRRLLERREGACDFNSMAELDSKLRRGERSIRKQL